MRRLLAGLLALIMLCSCLSGCTAELPGFLKDLFPQEEATEPQPTKNNNGSGSSLFDKLFGGSQAQSDCVAEQPKEAADPLVISDSLRTALDTSLILSPGSAHAFVGSVHTLLEGPLPVLVEDILLIPALAVTSMLGGQYTQESERYVLTLGAASLMLTPGSGTLLSGDQEVPLSMEIVREKGDLLVSASEFCAALGQSMTVQDDLVFIGQDTSAVENSDAMGLIGAALRSEFSCNDPELTSLGSVATGDGYSARADRSSCLVLTADMIPYTAENGETIAVAGSLFVEDLMIEGSSLRDEYYTCTMTVYNTGYTYGSIESFDANDNLIEFEKVKPFDGQKASITKALTDMVVLGQDIYQAIDNGSWAELDYRSSLNASKTTIKLEVPKDGYIFVTCNPQHSERVAVYNAVHTFFSLASLAQDIVKSKDSNAQEDLTDYVVSQIMANPNVVSEIAMEFTSVLTATPITPTDPAAYAQKLGEGILDLFARCEFDIEGVLQNSAKDLGTGALDKSVEGYLTKLLPVMEAAFTAWKISYAGSNTICLFMDLAYCSKTRSVIIEIGDWRAAYAQLLRERGNKGGERFVLGYVNGDGIPDLMVTYAFAHYGSYVEFYTYQQRQVKPIVDEYGGQQLGVAYGVFYYAEFCSVLMRGNMHMGITSTNYMHIIDNVLTTTEVFYDTVQTGESAEYYYNDEEVSKIYYNWKLNSFASEYDDHMICVNGGSDGWSISEENIKEVLKR